MNIKIKLISSILLMLFLLPLMSSSVYAKWDLEYWQYLNWKNWEQGPWKLYTIGELRANKDMSKFYYSRITENFAYQVLSNLDLEVHYSFIYHKSLGASRFTNTHRLEFEANSSLNFKDGITLTWRNRIELLKKQNISHIQFVFRHRLLATIPIENYGKLTSITMYDEIFYDFDTNIISQNRFVPIEMNFALSQHINLGIFFMVRNFFSFSLNKWHRSIVLGSELQF